MIQWIALAVAIDAESKASDARDKANEANSNSRGGSPLVIIQPFGFKNIPIDDDPKGFFSRLFSPIMTKKVLEDKPWGKVSLKRSDILSIQEYKDGNDVPYVKIRISEYSQVRHDGDHLVGLFVPGTIEAVAAVIGGV